MKMGNNLDIYSHKSSFKITNLIIQLNSMKTYFINKNFYEEKKKELNNTANDLFIIL